MTRIEIVARHLHRALFETLCVDVDPDTPVPSTRQAGSARISQVKMVPAWMQFEKQAAVLLAELDQLDALSAHETIKPFHAKHSWATSTDNGLPNHH